MLDTAFKAILNPLSKYLRSGVLPAVDLLPVGLFTWDYRFPGRDSLNASLRAMLSDAEGRITRRKPGLRQGTFPAEIVTFRRHDGPKLQLFCKHAAGRNHECHGHRGGVVYEAGVYRRVLQPLGAAVPEFYGIHTDAATGESRFAIEYLAGSMRLAESWTDASMVEAARWVGHFHALTEKQADVPGSAALIRYDRDYYLGWAERASRLGEPATDSSSWLSSLCGRFGDVVPCLLDAPLAVIHGEYYPNNVLVQGDTVYPVDWESSAVAAGEIDLASLTEGWPPETGDKCAVAYRQARWPSGLPPDSELRLSAARMYLQLRWLGDLSAAASGEGRRTHTERLRSAGEQLGLL